MTRGSIGLKTQSNSQEANNDKSHLNTKYCNGDSWTPPGSVPEIPETLQIKGLPHSINPRRQTMIIESIILGLSYIIATILHGLAPYAIEVIRAEMEEQDESA